MMDQHFAGKQGPIQFQDPQMLQQDTIESQLKARGPDGHFLGAVVWEELMDPRSGQSLGPVIHIGNPYQEHPDIVTLPTRCTKEQIEEIRTSTIWLEESCDIFFYLATAYEMRMPLIIEGEYSFGKTFMTNRFTECLYGPNVEPEEFYCSGQTDVAELTAKWVPNPDSMTTEDQLKWGDFLKTDFGKQQMADLAKITDESEGVDDTLRQALIQHKLTELAQSVGLSGKTQWKLELGAIPRAQTANLEADGTFTYKEGGHGTILHIQEVGTAKPAVVNRLLELRGRNRKVAGKFRLTEDGGRIIHSGPEFWVVMSTNPPGADYLDREPVDPALARGAIFASMGDLSEDSYRVAAEAYFGFRLMNKPAKSPLGTMVELDKHPELAREIASIVAKFHIEYKDALKKGEKDREQKIPATLDDFATLAEHCYKTQVRDQQTGGVDFAETIRRGIKYYYLGRHTDEKLVDNLELALETILTSKETGAKRFRGKIMTRADILKELAGEASLDPKQREQILQKRHQTAVQEALNDDDLPDHIKKMLGA